jgi:alpha-galactosidase
VVGLFNTGGRRALVGTTASNLGMARCDAYEVDDLWSHRVLRSAGAITADVPSHGVALYRITAVGDQCH